jgi:hypothetical protein
MLTASEFSQILDGRRGSLLRQKLVPAAVIPVSTVGIAQEDGEMNATTWGHRFESVTRRIYELEIAGVNTVCDTLGRFTHPTVPWLSASPDGIVMRGPLAGRLVEIKSPKSRQPGDFVPYEYYVQMQIQMEVCDLDAVDFIEAQFAQRPVAAFTASAADQAACKASRWKGRIEVRGTLEDSSTWRYRYSAPAEDLEDAVFNDGLSHEDDLLESSIWWLTGFYPRTVLRHAVWWSSIGWPNARIFWKDVEAGRTNPPPAPKQAIEVDVAAGGWLGSCQ